MLCRVPAATITSDPRPPGAALCHRTAPGSHRSPGECTRAQGGRVGLTPEAAPSGGAGRRERPLQAAQIPNPKSHPALHQHLVRDQPRPRGVEGTLGGSQQLPPCSWPTPRQSSEMDAAPPCPALPTRYLFKCSSRKRKVMRLGSGSERRRCIMQFSLAAGSERAGGEEREGSGQGPSPT